MRVIIEFEGTQSPGQVSVAPSDSGQISGSTQLSVGSATNAGPAPSSTGEGSSGADNLDPNVSGSTGAQPNDRSGGAAPQLSDT